MFGCSFDGHNYSRVASSIDSIPTILMNSEYLPSEASIGDTGRVRYVIVESKKHGEQYGDLLVFGCKAYSYAHCSPYKNIIDTYIFDQEDSSGNLYVLYSGQNGRLEWVADNNFDKIHIKFWVNGNETSFKMAFGLPHIT